MNPLLRKGGVHQRSRSAERGNQHQHLNQLVDEWFTDVDLEVDPNDTQLQSDEDQQD
jgi:hypothetical protein